MTDKLFYRSFAIDERTINKEDRSIELSFSSEEPLMRWFGKEVLLHGDKNVDMSRLRTMGSALLNHNPNMILGRITEARIEDRRGKAKLIFDEDEDGEKAFKKVQSKSLRGVSVGYMINKFKEIREDEEEYEGIKGPAYVATRWTPYEISLTPIPADSTVGIGRELTRSLEGIEIESNHQTMEVKDMDKQEVLQILNEVREKDQVKLVELIATTVRQIIVEDTKPKLRINAEDMNSLMGMASALSPDAELKVARMVGEGKTKEEIQRALLEMKTKPDSTNIQKGATDGLTPDPGKATFEKLNDDLFFRSFMNPSIMMN